MRKGLFKTGGLLLLSVIMTISGLEPSGFNTIQAKADNFYDEVVSKAGNNEMKAYGESILEDEANARVVTPVPEATSGTVYYIAPDGNDENNGTDFTTPWKSVEKVNATTFQPGDMVLFKAGGKWELTESLWPKGTGTEEKRIVIGAYGEGRKPAFSAKNIAMEYDGTFSDGVKTKYASDVLYLYNQEYMEIRDLDISNVPDGYTGEQSDSQKAMLKDRRGIHITGGDNKNETILKGFWLHDLYIHDVAGEGVGVGGVNWDPSKRTAGILFEIIKKDHETGLPIIKNPLDVEDDRPTWFEDVVIEENVLIDNSFGSIIFKQLAKWGVRDNSNNAPYYYHHNNGDSWYPHKNITIQDNYLDHSGSAYSADTIYLTNSADSVIRHNVSRGAGTSAIELYYTDGITIEWNEVFEAKQKPTGSDSNAIDPDKASTNALIQYNYVYNCGDGILLCGFIYGSSVVRYNVIQDCDPAKKYLNVHGDKGHNYIYNNIFYNSSDKNSIFISTSGEKSRYLDSTKNHHYFNNNIFYSPNAKSRVDDGTAVNYMGNVYHNVTEVPAEDTNALVLDPQFVNPSSVKGGKGTVVDLAGLRLKETSPLINSALDIAEHVGIAIPVGTLTDPSGRTFAAGTGEIGLFEFKGSASGKGGINGFVTDSYGILKAGATVVAVAGGKTKTTVTDDNGFYIIYGLPVGEACVKVSMNDYKDAVPVTLAIPEQDLGRASLILGASTLTTGTVTGWVTNGPGASVEIKNISGETVSGTTALSTGEFVFNQVPVGTDYHVVICYDGYRDEVIEGVNVKSGFTTELAKVALVRDGDAVYFYMKEDFNYDVGSFTGNSNWDVDTAGGIVEVQEDEDGNRYLLLEKSSNSNTVKAWNKNAIGAEGIFTIESRMKRTKSNGSSGASQFAFYSSEAIFGSILGDPMVDFGFTAGNKIFIHANQGSGSLTSYTGGENKWFELKMVVNMATDTFDFYVDGELKKNDAQLRTAGDAINYFNLFASANNLGNIMVDYLWVYDGFPSQDMAIDRVAVTEFPEIMFHYDEGSRIYTADTNIPAGISQVNLQVKPMDDFARVRVNGTMIGRVDDNETVTVAVTEDETVIPVVITSDSGIEETYTIRLKRTNEELVAYLSELQIDGLTFSPEFTGTEPAESERAFDAGNTKQAEHTLSYRVPVEGCKVTVTLNGDFADNENPEAVPLAFREGKNEITIGVTSKSGDEFKIYKITVVYDPEYREELKRLIEKAEAELLKADVYTEESINALKNVFETAKKAAEDWLMTQEEIDEQAALLKASVEALIPATEEEYFTKRIKVTKKPYKMVYGVDEDLDTSGMEVTAFKTATPSHATPSNATPSHAAPIKVVLEEDDYTPEYDFSEPGTAAVTIFYYETDADGEEQEFSDTFSVKVTEPWDDYFTTKITVEQKPDKLQYKVGEELEEQGMTVVAHESLASSSNARRRVLPRDEYETDYDFSSAGKRKVTILYEAQDRKGDIKTFKTSFTVLVTDNESGNTPQPETTLAGIRITKKPDKIVYQVGDTFDGRGMVVVADYSDGTSKEIFGYQVKKTRFTNTGKYKLSVFYQDQTTYVEVKVIRRYESSSEDSDSSSVSNRSSQTQSSQGFSMVVIEDMNVPLAGGPEGNTAGTWKKNDKGWWYELATGDYAKQQWVKIGNGWYLFNQDGYMCIGWSQIKGKWYFMHDSGLMAENAWVLSEGVWYYLKGDGSMAVDETTPDGYRVGTDGAWIK